MPDTNKYYKGYWMVTNRCNLRCTYCVLENASHQLKAELDLTAKKELVSHLYHNLGFRRLTLSGGEVIIFGKYPPKEFVELLRHIRTFKSSDPEKNLEIELYTNGTYLTDNVAQEMKGVVDTIAVTIDSAKDEFLSAIGRNHKGHKKYFEHIVEVCKRLTDQGIDLKLHSVVCSKNHFSLPEEVENILNSVEKSGGRISCWKFFQYMSYDDPERDETHKISPGAYEIFKSRLINILGERDLRLHFKDNKEMNDSLFNILSYGNAQYMRDGDTWTMSQRTEDLRSYKTMSDLFLRHDIDEARFHRFHELRR